MNDALKTYLNPPKYGCFSKMVRSVYPNLAKNVLHDNEAGPAPINAIFVL